ncbi:30S ribosomal protein S2 [Candidatus Gracilibacteria bacterium]|nr:30S ribosomal protein S2 [Candidatus Gracilibacteria bacterium]
MAQNDLKEMLDAAVHFGHKTQKWNPKMKKYIFGSRNGIHIFDLAKSKDCLDKAMEYLKMVSASGKKVLLVSTKPQAAQLILETAEATNMPYVIHKWIGGLITNFSTIKQRIKYLRNLKEQEKTGEIEKYTKKEASDIKKNIIKLEAALGGVKDLDRVPDVIFVADAVRDQIVIKEANKVKVPVVAIVDSNADPDGVAYPIPGNDDAIKSLTYLINKVKSAIMEGRGK